MKRLIVIAVSGLLLTGGTGCEESAPPSVVADDASVADPLEGDTEDIAASDGAHGGLAPGDPWEEGPYAPGHTTVMLLDDARERLLTVEVWYPSQGSESEVAPTETFEAEAAPRATLADLLEVAPDGCPTRFIGAARDASPYPGLGALPLAVFSHCMNCGRYASFSLAERLASHGMVVLAADHAGPLPFVEGAQGEPLESEQLDVRAADVSALIDAAIGGEVFAASEVLAGLSVDPEHIGAYGHSFGSVTVGRAAQGDTRIRAAAGLAAPMASLFFPSVTMAGITVPLLMVLAEEDNSIMEIGNGFLRDNVAEANPPVWRVDIADAGHWSISDVCGLTEAFMAGCGAGERHSEGRTGEAFEFLPSVEGIGIVQRYLTTFMLAHAAGDEGAMALLEALPEQSGVSVTVRLN
ncbi:MAG: alpha/beta hydrolase family protein [Myxococcota bacterium]